MNFLEVVLLSKSGTYYRVALAADTILAVQEDGPEQILILVDGVEDAYVGRESYRGFLSRLTTLTGGKVSCVKSPNVVPSQVSAHE